eukprot:TRINITY_DN19609_c0_g1_i1.p1 TRINITY_DN19609_c0_g1~~TRINITY_DN19609_c0_g1_i1.p1  ORF type:complete len:897 (-),score=123.03 TRINITY_DN19609_c0_g1_i1:77-2767(-)
MNLSLWSSLVYAVGATKGLQLEVNRADGSYNIALNGLPWLTGADYVLGDKVSSKGALVLTNTETSHNADVFGKYTATTLSWSDMSTAGVLMKTSFREYEENDELLVFEQFFPQEFLLSSSKSGLAAGTIFPSFARQTTQTSAKWTCQVGQGGSSADEQFKASTVNSETSCSKLCSQNSKCVAFDYTERSKRDACRLFDSSAARLGDGGYDKRTYCKISATWTCQVGQGGSSASEQFKASTANSETSCGKLCSQNSNCVAFDYTRKSQPDACRLFDSSAARLGDGGYDKRMYCKMSSVDVPLSCFSYHGTFPAMKSCSLATYKESNLGGIPLVLYNTSDARLPMTVFSPLNQPMAHHMAHTDSYIGAGVKATVETIPSGWSQLFILSAGLGINAGMMSWGSRLLKFTGRPLVDNRYLDDCHGAIGFWTDNGGYYHYAVGNNESLGKTYEDVLPKVKAYHDELGVPFKHWQFDSWFYPKNGGVDPGGGGGAVTNWTSKPDIFPHGMAHIQSLLGVPMIMHNRQWATNSDYVRHWTDIEWYFSKQAAVPKDPVKFFDRFFTQQDGWGLSMYEQDWMDKEYNEVEALRTNISMGDLWLRGMAEGAARSNRTVQYCMPLPSEVLSASYLPAVTNARATGDYFHSTNQWAIGQTALFYWALNILPFKDGFYSSTNKQVGGQTEGPEQHPDREALMATLSAATVGPMDGIYLLNASRVMTTCRGDGKVLKPDRPLTPPDSCFLAGNPTCHVYYTYSDVIGLGRVTYYYNDDGKAPMLAAEVDLVPQCGNFAIYNWYTEELAELKASNSLASGYEGHVYAIVVPIVQSWIFVGEVDKYVVASRLRFPEVTVKDFVLTARVRGVRGETVKICAAEMQSREFVCKLEKFMADGERDVSFYSSGVVI